MHSEAHAWCSSGPCGRFADGYVSVLLAHHLVAIGFTPLQVGVIVTGTLVGSAALTLLVGLAGVRLGFRTVLLGASALMSRPDWASSRSPHSSLSFAVPSSTPIRPAAGDVSVFLPTEQAFLAGHATGTARTRLYAFYNAASAENFAGALGALASGAITVHRLSALRRGRRDRRSGLPGLPATSRDCPRLPNPSNAHGLSSFSSPPCSASTPPAVASSSNRCSSSGSTSSSTSRPRRPPPCLLLRRDPGRVLTVPRTSPGQAHRTGSAPSSSPPPCQRLPHRRRARAPPRGRPRLLAVEIAAVTDGRTRPPSAGHGRGTSGRWGREDATDVPRSLAAAVTPVLAGWLSANGSLAAPLVLAGSAKAAYDLLLLWRFRSAVLNHDRTP